MFMSTASEARYLSKSRFKLALECPTKLFYAKESNGYFDKNQDNDFLHALADGGNQVGELAKFKYHPDPIGEGITVEPLGYEEAISQTQVKMSVPTRSVIAEAALLHETFFVRVDILIHDPMAKTIEIIEVKSKSVDDAIIASRFKNDKGNFLPKWLPYLYDITFQSEVARRCFPDYKIISKLLLLDSSEVCDVDRLHQNFKIVTVKDRQSGKQRVRIETPSELTRDDLGRLSFLREVLVDDIVHELRAKPIDNSPHVPSEHGTNLNAFMSWVGRLQADGALYFGGVSKACKSCQFRAGPSESKKSGVHECWQAALSQGLLDSGRDIKDRGEPLSIDIWGGGSGSVSMADRVIDARRAFLAHVQEDDVRPKKESKDVGMSSLERRMFQVKAASEKTNVAEINEEILSAMDTWEWPLHMIDFETSAPAIPFFRDMHPYQTLAFQFSHHIMEKLPSGKVKIRHANQWISTKAESFPSIEFVRQLRNALMPNGQLIGTVFRYHNHENSVLRSLRKTILSEGVSVVPDMDALVEFIDLITKSTSSEASFEGEKQMVDLHRLIQKGYYSSVAGGSISLKYMLPAVLHDAPAVSDLYRKPKIYGAGFLIDSLNFNEEGHIWLQADKGNDPYKTLPGIFGPDHGELDAIIARLAGDEEGEDGAINQGGLAMTAYNYTQFASLKDADRERIQSALLRYCELDTLAMVILVQGLMELRGASLAVQ
jgi:hypothetical protein